MEADDIEDGEILEDESNEPTFPVKECPNNNEFPIANKDFTDFESFEQKIHHEVKNTFEEFFSAFKEKRNHHHESHKNSRRDRSSFSDIPRKRRRMDDGDGCIRNDKMYYEKNNKSNYEVPSMKNYDEEANDDDMIYVLGGSLNDSEKPHKPMKNEMPYEFSNDLNDSMMYPNEDESDDSRPYHKRSPLRRDNYKKDRSRSRGLSDRGPDRGFDRGPDRGLDRGFDRGPDRGLDRGTDRGPDRCQIGMAKRRGRGGGVGARGGGEMHRKGKPRDRDDTNDFYNQGKNPRGNNEPMYSHQYSMPRKLEVCKFYLNDCCTKRDKCIYMHNDFPCKYHHTPGLTCHLGKSCKFSHSKLDEIQRAVLKKYADIPCKEIDDMQRFHRENSGNSTYSAHKEKKESANANNQNSRIPSLFEVKIPVPPEFRGDDEEGGSTPMPSPQSASQMYDDDEHDETIYDKMNHDHNDRHTETTTDGEDTDRKLSNEDTSHKSHHRKKSKKSDDYNSDGDRRKHSEKRKKHSKKEDRKFDKKKKHEQKQVENTYSNMFPELEEPPWDIDFDKEDEPQEQAPAPVLALTPAAATPAATPAIVEEQRSPKHEQKEPSDALSHLPKKQQELFLRIQQHQKEAETGQSSNIDEKDDEEDSKADVNWYSSDEEEPEKPESSSPLATILRTIQTNSNNVPTDEKSDNSNPVNTYLPVTSSSRPVPTQETDSVMVDASQLANIDLSDEVTQLLTSIMKTDASASNQPAATQSVPSNTDKDDRMFSHTRRPSEDKNYQMDQMTSSATKPSVNEDVDLRYLNANSILNTASLFASNNHESNPNNDIDFRTLPFKPVPIHDAATEINASITAHPPMEYKLTPLSFIPRVNYASMTDVAKVCGNDPRFKRKLMNASSVENAENSHTVSPFASQDPRHALALKSMNETPRIDPRLADPRKTHTIDPRLDTKNFVPNSKLDQRPDPRMMEAKIPDKEPVRPIVDFRDPRLKSCKFPEIPMPFPMMTPLPPILPEMAAPMPVRKEDPRLKYRANQK